MIKNDEELTKFVLKNSNTNFSEEFIIKLSANSQTSRLATKYDLIENAIKDKKLKENISISQQELEKEASQAYIYAKIASGKFFDIRPRIDSTQTLEYIISNYQKGYKYMMEAVFMKISYPNILNYVKGKIEGNSFYNKITGVTNTQPIDVKTAVVVNKEKINKIKNIIIEIKAKEEEKNWLDGKLKKKNEAITKKVYELNYAQ